MKDRHLFRGKRIDNGIWEEGFHICDKFHSYIGTCAPHFDEYDNLCIEHNFEVDPKTIGQCTGLKDTNGTLIFEGDICIGDNGKKTEIVFADYNFRHRILGDIHCNSISYLWVDMYSIEVVGNIHEDN